ncbi:MAG: hypothetical protein MUF15_13055 [Acidobacteria bacterium]|jgi:hypothetical protein|nr:hypothetical protein [Acidobacteriota bacterium]
MVIDYKGVTFSFKEKRRRQWVKKIRVFLFILLLIGIYLVVRNFIEAGKIKTIQGLLLDNKVPEAAEKLKDIEGSFFYKGTKKELKALLMLAEGNRENAANARAILESLHSANSLINYLKFLDYFSKNALYRELKIYTNYLVRGKGTSHDDDLLFYKAMYSAALFDYNGSQAAIGQMPAAEKEKHKQELAIIDKIVNEMKTGKIN